LLWRCVEIFRSFIFYKSDLTKHCFAASKVTIRCFWLKIHKLLTVIVVDFLFFTADFVVSLILASFQVRFVVDSHVGIAVVHCHLLSDADHGMSMLTEIVAKGKNERVINAFVW